MRLRLARWSHSRKRWWRLCDAGESVRQLPNTHDFISGVSSSPYIKDADVIVVVESDVPWYPQGKPSESAKVIQIARDPNYSDIPIRSFPKDISIGGDPKLALELLAQELTAGPRNEKLLAERAEKIRAKHKQYRERAETESRKHEQPKAHRYRMAGTASSKCETKIPSWSATMACRKKNST